MGIKTGIDCKRDRGEFWGDDILYLDFSGGYKTVFTKIQQNICLKQLIFFVWKVYLNISAKKKMLDVRHTQIHKKS